MNARSMIPAFLLWGSFCAAGAPDNAVPIAAHWAPPVESAPMAVFGGRPAKFDLEVTAPSGSQFVIDGDLSQIAAGGWTMPLKKNIRLSAGLQFETRTQQTITCVLPDVPAVRGPSQMLLALRNGSTAIGSIKLLVFPPPAPDEWKKSFAAALAQGGLTRTAVFGGGEMLRAFLQRRYVPFDDLGPDWPAALDSKSLYLADAPPEQTSSLPAGVHVILFLPNQGTMLPGIYATRDAAGGVTVKVTLPLDRLDTDPRAQETLSTVINQVIP